MEEEKKLYPMRICTIEDEYPWGREQFKLADLGYRDSLIRDGWLAGNTMSELMDTYMDRVVGENVFEYYGRQFPLQVRIVEVEGRMPLRVHPDDETAAQRYDFLGKDKFWYVLSADRDARLGIGFSADTDADALYRACLDNTAASLMAMHAPAPGECFHIPAGTVHFAAGKVRLLEISESSPMDFCLCGWGDPVSEDEFDPSLSLVDALDFIDYSAAKASQAPETVNAQVRKLLKLPQFSVSVMTLENPLRIKNSDSGSFSVYVCIKGKASVDSCTIEEGDLVLVPAECQDFIISPEKPGTVLVEAMTENREDKDPYIIS